MEIIYSKDIFKESGIYNVNMLYRKENVYLMDNHLSALWCWVKHRQEEKIIIGNPQIIHVDHHNDYEEVPNNKETRKAVSKICKQTFEQFISELNENIKIGRETLKKIMENWLCVEFYKELNRKIKTVEYIQEKFW